jgi:4-hydroxy-tetrahydrodipicolinate synthase
MSGFQGILVPMLTPFTEDDELDIPALNGHIDFLVAGGVHGLIPAGSTGEAMSLSPDEYRTVVAETVRHVAGRVPVIAGCSANATRQVVANCRQAEELGADGIMLVHPYYSLPDERELCTHYETVSKSVNVPVIIYNNPFTTGVDAKPELLVRLSELPHIEYVKESSGDATRILRLIEGSRGRLAVLCGTDNLALEGFLVGARGWVAGAANVIPQQCAALYRLAVEERRFDEALALYRQLYAYLTVAEATGKFVQVNKAALALLGRRAGPPRPPLQHIDGELLERTRRALEQVSAVPAAR